MSSQLERGLDILETLSKKGPLNIEKINAYTLIPRSTVFKLLQILEKADYVSKEINKEDSVLWCPTLKLVQMSSSILSRMDIKEDIRDILVDLSRDAGEVVQLGIFNKGKVMYIDVVKSHDSIISFARIGNVLDINISAAGMVLASALAECELDKILKDKRLEKKTKYTIEDISQLKKVLKKVKKDRYAYDDQQYAIGVRCLAAPVLNFENKVVAAINITGYISTMTDEKIEDLKEKLLRAALKSSKKLGFREQYLFIP